MSLVMIKNTTLTKGLNLLRDNVASLNFVGARNHMTSGSRLYSDIFAKLMSNFCTLLWTYIAMSDLLLRAHHVMLDDTPAISLWW